MPFDNKSKEQSIMFLNILCLQSHLLTKAMFALCSKHVYQNKFLIQCQSLLVELCTNYLQYARVTFTRTEWQIVT